jgi:hypothetical protein
MAKAFGKVFENILSITETKEVTTQREVTYESLLEQKKKLQEMLAEIDALIVEADKLGIVAGKSIEGMV